MRGKLAALHAAYEITTIRIEDRDREAVALWSALARHCRGLEFLDTFYRPAAAFRLPVAEAIVCRCEEVATQQIVDTVKMGCVGPNQIKSFMRCGMGPCHDRFCGLTVTELIARERGTSPEEVGHYHLRPQVKPLTLGELAALPQTQESIEAVGRLGKSH